MSNLCCCFILPSCGYLNYVIGLILYTLNKYKDTGGLMTEITRYIICSNVSCRRAIPYDAGALYQFKKDRCSPDLTLEKMLKEYKGDDHNCNNSPPPYCEKYCSGCGAENMFYCPHCKNGLFASDVQDYCGECAKPIPAR